MIFTTELPDSVFEFTEEQKEAINKKPYKKLMFNNGMLTVIFNDATMLSIDTTLDVFYKVRDARTEMEVLRLINPKLPDTNVIENLDKNINIYGESISNKLGDEFSFVNEKVYYKTISLPIPGIVVSSLINAVEENDYDKFTSLINFFLKMCVNPVETCRENVLRFCQDNDIRLTKSGNIVGYRRVVKLEKDEVSPLSKFVTDSYNKIKRWKKSVKNYYVYEDTNNEHELLKVTDHVHDHLIKNVGRLDTLYNTCMSETDDIYTSSNNKGRYTFKIGDVYKLDGEEPDSDTGNCSSNGLHGASCHYDYSSFGDTPIVVLINPAKTIFVPSNDSAKFRTSEMKIAMINPNSHGVHIDESLLEKADGEYNDYGMNELEEIAKSKSFVTVSVNDVVPEITFVDLNKIKEELKNRIVKI